VFLISHNLYWGSMPRNSHYFFKHSFTHHSFLPFYISLSIPIVLFIKFHCHSIFSYCLYNSTATVYFHTVYTIPLPQYTIILFIQFHCHSIPSYCLYNSTATVYFHTVYKIPLPQYTFILFIKFHCHSISSYSLYNYCNSGLRYP
jgi:hypothetical protein